jgi:hypothetical protein
VRRSLSRSVWTGRWRMRDLDSELTGLRDTLRAAVYQPPTEEMIKRGRRRVRRQQAQVAAVVALIVTAGAWPFLQIPDSTAPAVPHRSYVLTQDYYDTRSAFALGGTCRTDNECEPWFMTTANGQTWETRTIPPVDVQYTGLDDKVTALGTSRVVIEDFLANKSSNRYYSDDGGRTWSSVATRPDITIQEIPEDAALETTTDRPSAGTLCRDGQVIAMLSDSGRSAKLATQPPIDLTWCQPYPDLNGTRWVAGSDPRTHQPVTASTRDRGRTWQVTPLPGFTPPSSDRIATNYPLVIVVSTPAASYASVIDPGTSGLLAMFRSSDFGATWTRTWQTKGDRLSVMAGTPVAGTDGNIRFPHDLHTDSVWTSADGGATFVLEPAMHEAWAGTMRWVRPGYLSSAENSASTGRYLLSYDGISWLTRQIPMPG